jgi:purine-binding chemotaxis protein CheW
VDSVTSGERPAGDGPEEEILDAAELAHAGAQRRATIQDGSAFEPDRTFVAFQLAGEPYAIPLEWVQKIERVPPVVPVPRTPPFVRGIASLRGEIVCVVDLRQILGLPGSTQKPHGLLVLQEGTRRVALLSDVLPDYFRVKPSAILPSPSAKDGEGIVTEIIERKGATGRADTFVALLDVKKLLDSLGSRLDA